MEEVVKNLAQVAMAMIMLAITLWVFILISSSIFEEKKIYEKLKSFLVKTIETGALILAIGLVVEIVIGHIFSDYEGLIQKIVNAIRNDINLNSKSDLPTSIGYLQLLVAVITLAIGGIALINYVIGKEVIKKIKAEHKEAVDTLSTRVGSLENSINNPPESGASITRRNKP